MAILLKNIGGKWRVTYKEYFEKYGFSDASREMLVYFGEKIISERTDESKKIEK